ncbi:hypothetical protein EC991_005243 [Linnemannia zychae]|nr:hypothetical protein EC991_005243 [Linnemannia zychae]
MSSTFPLPLECLQLIILHLTRLAAYESIASLIRVNKFVCAAAVPFLYQDPFADVYHFPIENEDLARKSGQIRKLKHLLRVLLCSLPTTTSISTENGHCHQDGMELLTELLKAAYFNEQELKEEREFPAVELDCWKTTWIGEETVIPRLLLQPLQPTLLPYYSYMTTVAFENFNHASAYLHDRKFFVRQPAVLEYLDKTGRADRWLAEEPYRSISWESPEDIDVAIISEATQAELRRDLTWAICLMNAERIRTLSISLSDIGRFLTLVPRFKVLSKVTFQLDRSLTFHLQTEQRLALEEDKLLRRLQEERKQYLEGMIMFVQEHQCHHAGVLRTALYCNDRAYLDPCPEEYHFRLLQLLPPLYQPQSLDRSNWEHFAVNVANTDLSRVKQIIVRPMTVENQFWDIVLNQSFLHRCRSLEKIDMQSLGEDVFKWAVKARKEYDPCNENSAPSSSGLFPLRYCNIHYTEPSYGHQINDIAYAFSNTLEDLVIRGFIPYDLNSIPNSPNFSLGCNDDDDDGFPSWPELPRLRTLHANTHWALLRIHRRLFSKLPRLTSLDLRDRLSHYSLAEVVHWEPVSLPELGDLTLIGASAICFHPDILKNARKLSTLNLHLYDEIGDGYSYIPDPQEFEAVEQGQDSSDSDSSGDLDDNSSPTPPLTRQPVWTWDWDLPNLTHLVLASEFAYRFQFRMLATTPNLTYLSLNIKSISRQHRRTVGIADLVKPGFDHPALARILYKELEQQEKRRQLPYWDAEAYYAARDAREDGEEEEDDENEPPQVSEDTKEEEDDVWQEFEFLYLPTLTYFTLNGPWMLDYRVLKALFSKVAPQIEILRLPGCYGFTIPEWIQSTSESLHHLQMGCTTIRLFSKMATQVGLVRDEGNTLFGVYKLAERPVGRVPDTPALYQFH